MARRAREEPAPEEAAPEPGMAEEPVLERYIFLERPGTTEPAYEAIVGPEEEEIMAEALRRCGGPGAVLDHLDAIDAQVLLGRETMRRPVWIRDQDFKLIAQALKADRDPEILAVFLADAVFHGWVRENRYQMVMRESSLRDTCEWREETIKQLGRELKKFGKGRELRHQQAEHRREIIRQLLNAGENNARKILRTLKRDHAINVELKTVQNDISSIRKQLNRLP